jgi:hypothetical protein
LDKFLSDFASQMVASYDLTSTNPLKSKVIAPLERFVRDHRQHGIDLDQAILTWARVQKKDRQPLLWFSLLSLARPRIAFFDEVAAWVKKNPNTPGTGIALLGLLRLISGPKAGKILSSGGDLLQGTTLTGAKPKTPYSRGTYVGWIFPDMAMDWIRKNPQTPVTSWLLVELLQGWTPQDRIIIEAIDWLKRNDHAIEAGGVMMFLLRAARDERKLIRIEHSALLLEVAGDWIKEYASSHVALRILRLLLTDYPYPEIRPILLQWLQTVEYSAGLASLITFALRRGKGDPLLESEVLKLAVQAPNLSRAARLIGALVSSEQLSKKTVGYANDWLQQFGGTPEADYVLVGLMAGRSWPPNEVRRTSLKWLVAFGNERPAHRVLIQMLDTFNDDATVKLAMEWVKNNFDFEGAYFVVRHLIGGVFGERKDVIRMARNWVSNSNNPFADKIQAIIGL